MIDSVLNLLFRCPHRRLTRPLSPVTKAGQPHSQTYVVCLDCGKQFEYNTNEMHIGKAIDHSHDHSIMPPNMPTARGHKIGLTLLAALPAAFALGAFFRGRSSSTTKPK